MNRFQQWALSRKPQQNKTTVKEVEIPATPEEEFKEAWEDFTYHLRKPIAAIKIALLGFSIIAVISAIAIVNIQANCFLDYKCRVEIERVNK